MPFFHLRHHRITAFIVPHVLSNGRLDVLSGPGIQLVGMARQFARIYIQDNIGT